jgi:hypothetical protein
MVRRICENPELKRSIPEYLHRALADASEQPLKVIERLCIFEVTHPADSLWAVLIRRDLKLTRAVRADISRDVSIGDYHAVLLYPTVSAE